MESQLQWNVKQKRDIIIPSNKIRLYFWKKIKSNLESKSEKIRWMIILSNIVWVKKQDKNFMKVVRLIFL